MDENEVLFTSTLLKQLILRGLISEEDVFTLLSVSSLPRDSVTTVIEQLVLLLERDSLASTLSGEPPIASPQALLQLLTSLLEIRRPAVRHLAGDVLCHISKDPVFAVWVADCGAVQYLLRSLKEHKELSELMAARVIEILFATGLVAESSTASSAISGLATYLLDPDTRSAQGKLIISLALGNLFQSQSCARSAHALEGAFALVHTLKEDPYEDDLKVVALCSLENLLISNKDIGAVLLKTQEVEALEVLLHLVQSPNQVVSVQATALLKLLGSVPESRDYMSSQSSCVVRAISAAMYAHGENKYYTEVVESLFRSFPRLSLTMSVTSSLEIEGLDCLDVMLDLIQSNNRVISIQAAAILNLFCSIRESRYHLASKSSRVLRAVLNAMEEHGGKKGYLEIVESIYSSFPSLTLTEAATSSITQLVTCLSADDDATQQSALRCLILLSKTWASPSCPREVLEAQLLAFSPAGIALNQLIWDGNGSFKDTSATHLLEYLPAKHTTNKPHGRRLHKLRRFFCFVV